MEDEVARHSFHSLNGKKIVEIHIYIYKFRQRDPIRLFNSIRYTFAGLPVHISDQFTEPVFPFNIRLGLYPLVGVTHHGNQ